MFLSALLIVLLGFSTVEAISLLAILVALLMAPIVVVLFVWLRMLESSEANHPPL